MDKSLCYKTFCVAQNRPHPFHIPVYLEPDIADFLQQLADKKEIDVTTVVNGWLRKDMELIQLAS